MARRKIFLTGFPGFIGRWLVRAIGAKARECDFTFLVVDPFVAQARREVDALRRNEPFREAGLDVVAGDITRTRLGLDEKTYARLQGETTDAFHLAAIYDLAVPEATARAVNVGGTRNIVEFCRGAKHLRALVHFSTCYVAGKRTGLILEDELTGSAGFKNHYESTKFEAEAVVRESRDRVPTIIIRPGITVGHSKTGETQKFDGPYFGMILIDQLKVLRLPLPYLGPSEAEVNLVPVDFVVDGTVAIWLKDGTTGKCYALADPRPILAREIYSDIVRLLGARGPLLRIPPRLVELSLGLPAVRKALGVPREVLEYFNHQAHFDTRNADAALAGTGVSCPSVREYMPVLVSFYQANKGRTEMRWKPY
jgi:thioester reductase-like protein